MKFFTVFILLLIIHGFVVQEIAGIALAGSETSADDFPWMVLVSRSNTTTNGTDDVCGGSIISDTFVITAAHCFSGDHMNFKRFSIRAGIRNIVNASEETEQIHSIVDIRVHPEYSNTNFPIDLALVRVSPPFNFTTGSIKKIALSNLKSLENTTLVTIEWGILNQSNPLEAATSLQYINVQENIGCTQNESINPTGLLCATLIEPFPASFRDNGSPLMIYFNDSQQYELFGVTSYCEVCTTESLFTRIAPSLGWILKTLADPPPTTTSTTQSTSLPTIASTTSTSPPTIASTTSKPTSTSGTVTNPITTTPKNNAIVIESKLFLVSIICMLFNVVLIK